jgi:hypothetical protein
MELTTNTRGGLRGNGAADKAARFIELSARWIGRIVALALLFFWGAFFIEHVSEWYGHPLTAMPPWWVGLSMVCHAAVIVGLGVMLFRAWPRVWITLAGTLGFLGAVAIGKRTLSPLPYIVLVNLVPITLAIGAWAIGRWWSTRGVR